MSSQPRVSGTLRQVTDGRFPLSRTYEPSPKPSPLINPHPFRKEVVLGALKEARAEFRT